MKNLLPLLALLSVSLCFAQEYQYMPFPTANAQWNTDGYDGNCLPPGLCSQGEVAIVADTVVNGHTYRLVNGMDNGAPYQFTNAWFREDVEARKVYAKWPSGSPPDFDGAVEYVAYDFSLSVGDTFMVPPPLNMSGLSDTHYYVITSIDTIQIGEGLRKRFWFNPNFTVSSNYWIEGIGGEPGPFRTHYMFEGWNVLRCMYHEGELIYSNPLPGPPEYNLQTYPWYEYCGPYWVGITHTENSSPPTVFPNPVQDMLHVRFDGNIRPLTSFLSDVLGRTQQVPIAHVTASEVHFDLRDLPQGHYFLRLSYSDSTQSFHKIVKQ